MTKGNSISLGTPYGNFIRGNNDKLMISYRREASHAYTMNGACGVLFEGEMHFFGGERPCYDRQGVSCFQFESTGYLNINDLSRQHFVIETKRSEQLVKMTKKEDLEVGFDNPLCSSFEMTSENFPLYGANVVILCFGYDSKSCYLFDGKMIYFIGDSKHHHSWGGLTKYKNTILTVGGGFYSPSGTFYGNQKTEILKQDENQNSSGPPVEKDFKFTRGEWIIEHSLVTVESSNLDTEYVLLIGGMNRWRSLKKVFKFNDGWFPFGKLKKSRSEHNSIYWNGAVYVIGGNYETDGKTKIEIWNTEDTPDKFKTNENWPELFSWVDPHLFVVPDSLFPDY